MSVDSFDFQCGVNWRIVNANGVFTPTVQADGRSVSLAGIDLTGMKLIFDEITINGGAEAIIDLRAFLNSDGQGSPVDCAALSLDSAILLYVETAVAEDVVNAALIVKPATSNGWTGFWPLPTSGNRIGRQGSLHMQGEPTVDGTDGGTAGPNVPVTNSSRYLSLSNPGTEAISVFFLVAGY